MGQALCRPGGDAASEPLDAEEDVGTDDDEEYEEAGGNRLLGFMFGNVDDSGDLDVDYLDEDAKEHLAALADKLGSSLKDIDLSIKSVPAQFEATDQDYDTKAENAVDYEDIDEEYDGPEVENPTEEDLLVPKKDFFLREVPVTSFEKTSMFDDDNYDYEDDDSEKQVVSDGGYVEAQTLSPAGLTSFL
ncbi:hypothetical protein M569_12870 [Genlisea aurea]|uniref:TAFII-230 TBP-binding domain-containing protein n=1 Tax=Genlisea aurea TaxID=192259 RepID=S8DGL6_9LAMI|nr:hypothetical protein M569_12870 [Genlisea aurea]